MPISNQIQTISSASSILNNLILKKNHAYPLFKNKKFEMKVKCIYLTHVPIPNPTKTLT